VVETTTKKIKSVRKEPDDQITNINQAADVAAARKGNSFWQSKTFEQLAREQGVKPIKDLNQLKGHWPEGADFDSFFETAVNSRKHAEDN
jgi:ribosomal protein L14E/L6E/L27E